VAKNWLGHHSFFSNLFFAQMPHPRWRNHRAMRSTHTVSNIVYLRTMLRTEQRNS
jgi:hypothetical protein